MSLSASRAHPRDSIPARRGKRLSLYSFFAQLIGLGLSPWLSWKRGPTPRRSTWRDAAKSMPRDPHATGTSSVAGREVVWIHAASVGELESLWPIAQFWAKEPVALVLTYFSASAARAVGRLAGELKEAGALVLYSGPSPLEGGWWGAFEILRPRLWLTAKYEAWPELWASASLQNIPLATICARARGSMRWAKKISGLLGVQPPRLHFWAADKARAEGLRREFEMAEVRIQGDPRWARVLSRASSQSSRASSVTSAQKRGEGEKWGCLAQIYAVDLELWHPALLEIVQTQAQNFLLWAVPHEVDPSTLTQLESRLSGLGFDVVRTSMGVPMARESRPRAVLVDEVGILVELYRSMDWVYVGGGFGPKGLHSTLEPAVQRLPIAAGPLRSELADEVELLAGSGQLTRVQSPDEILRFLREHTSPSPVERTRWERAWEAQCNAHEAIFSELRAVLSSQRAHAKSPPGSKL